MEDLEHYEIKGLIKLETGLLLSVGKVALKLAEKTGDMAGVRSYYKFENEEWQYYLADHRTEVSIPTGIK